MFYNICNFENIPRYLGYRGYQLFPTLTMIVYICTVSDSMHLYGDSAHLCDSVHLYGEGVHLYSDSVHLYSYSLHVHNDIVHLYIKSVPMYLVPMYNECVHPYSCSN